MDMTRFLIATIVALTLSACSGSDDTSKAQPETTAQALETTSKPFSVGTGANDMGGMPPGELDDGITDPYERMAKAENTQAPARDADSEMQQ